jgi:hypothetical protein
VQGVFLVVLLATVSTAAAIVTTVDVPTALAAYRWAGADTWTAGTLLTALGLRGQRQDHRDGHNTAGGTAPPATRGPLVQPAVRTTPLPSA